MRAVCNAMQVPLLALAALAALASASAAIEVREAVNEGPEVGDGPRTPASNSSVLTPTAPPPMSPTPGPPAADRPPSPSPAGERITLPSFRPSPRVPGLLGLHGDSPRASHLQLRETASHEAPQTTGLGVGVGLAASLGAGEAGGNGGGFKPGAAPVPELDLDAMRKIVKQFKQRDDEDGGDDGHKSLQDYDAVVMAYLKALKAKNSKGTAGGHGGVGGSPGGPALSEPKHKQFGFSPTGGAGGGGSTNFGGGGGLSGYGGLGGGGGGFSDFGKGGSGGGTGSGGFTSFGKGGGRGGSFGGGDKSKHFESGFPGFGGGAGGSSGGYGTTGFGGLGSKGKGGGTTLMHTGGHPYPYHVGQEEPVAFRIPAAVYHHEAGAYVSKDRDEGDDQHRGPGGGLGGLGALAGLGAGKAKGLAALVKKALHMAAAFIPLGLFLAALPPTVLNINSTQGAPGPSPPGGRQRSLDGGGAGGAGGAGAAAEGASLEDALLERWGARALEGGACEARLLCELARAGARPDAPALSAALWALAAGGADDVTEALQLREVFKAARTDACDIYRCAQEAPALGPAAAQPPQISAPALADAPPTPAAA